MACELRRRKQSRDTCDCGDKFSGVIRTDHALAPRKPQRLYNAGERDTPDHGIERLRQWEGEKIRHRQASLVQNFALAQLAAAILHRFRRVVTQSQQAGGLRGSGCLTVGQCQNRANRSATNRRRKVCSGLLGLVEMERDRSVGPGIFELMAAIAANDDGKAESPGCFGKATRLISELAGKQKQRSPVFLLQGFQQLQGVWQRGLRHFR